MDQDEKSITKMLTEPIVDILKKLSGKENPEDTKTDFPEIWETLDCANQDIDPNKESLSQGFNSKVGLCIKACKILQQTLSEIKILGAAQNPSHNEKLDLIKEDLKTYQEFLSSSLTKK